YSEDLYLAKMADIVGTTPKYFSNFFKKAFGINFVDYLNRVRISHAKEYLKNSDISINELSNKLGYNHSRTFTSIFKKYIGIPPTEYRKQYR
ncbi:MAG: helix-turn-helix transcriptional regulator, partial [Clostridiaceae bacterium]|nr:helix-turn-helix transcriptional regulator [Clostridiaceae bacterium]